MNENGDERAGGIVVQVFHAGHMIVESKYLEKIEKQNVRHVLVCVLASTIKDLEVLAQQAKAEAQED